MEQKLVRALRIMYERLRNMRLSWVIIGSTGLALQGVDITPNDIDILTDDEGALTIHREFKQYETKPLEKKENELFRSMLGALEIEGVKVEIMADLEVNIQGNWRRKSYVRTTVQFEGMELPVYPLKASLEAYRAMNRPKDQKKIRKIEAALGKADGRKKGNE